MKMTTRYLRPMSPAACDVPLAAWPAARDIEACFPQRPTLVLARARRLIAIGWTAGALLVTLSNPLGAQTGINLSWDDCGSFGAESKTFVCNTNVGSSTMVGSFAAPPGIVLSYALDMVLDLQSAGDVLPAWWVFMNAGSCRQNALHASVDFTATCVDFYGGDLGVLALDYQSGTGAPNRARIRLRAMDIFGVSFSAVPGIEYYAFKLAIVHDRTNGGDACAGCEEGVCIVLNEIRFYQWGMSDVFLTAPLTRNYVTWQAGIPNCPAATPVHKSTWGGVKSLYR